MNRITQISLSSKHAAAVDDKGNLYTWGTGTYGELCHPIATTLHSPYPVEWSGRTFCNRVICHKNLTCVITGSTILLLKILIIFIEGKSDIIIYGSFNGNEIDKEDLFMKARQIQNLPKSQIVDISFGDNFGVVLTGIEKLIDIKLNLLQTKGNCMSCLSISSVRNCISHSTSKAPL